MEWTIGHAVDVRLKFLLPRINRIGTSSTSKEYYLKTVILEEAEILKTHLSKLSVQVFNPRSEGAFNSSFGEPNYNKLLSTIKKRLQKPNESVVQYFATMENLFLRLPQPLFMQEQIEILQRNLMPHYVTALSTYTFTEMNVLKETCRRIETSNARLQFSRDFRQNDSSTKPGVNPTWQNYPVHNEQNSNTRPQYYYKSSASQPPQWEARTQQQNSRPQVSQITHQTNPQQQNFKPQLQSGSQWQTQSQQPVQRSQTQPNSQWRPQQRPQYNNWRSNPIQKNTSVGNNSNYTYNQNNRPQLNTMESSTIYPQIEQNFISLQPQQPYIETTHNLNPIINNTDGALIQENFQGIVQNGSESVPLVEGPNE